MGEMLIFGTPVGRQPTEEERYIAALRRQQRQREPKEPLPVVEFAFDLNDPDTNPWEVEESASLTSDFNPFVNE